VHGELPKAVSVRGAEWPELVRTTTSATVSLEEQVQRLQVQADALQRQVDLSRRD
jgi:hypothetical protein